MRLARAPGDAGHRRQPLERRHRLLEEALGTRLLLQQLGEHLQPALHRQPDREQIAREEHAEAAAAARIPSEADEQHRRSGEKHGVGERLEIARARQGHEGEAAQDHDHQHEHQEHAVEEIDDLRRFRRFGLRREQRDQHEQEGQHVLRRAPRVGIDLAARRDLRQYRDREQREQVDEHHEVAAPLPFRVVLVHLAADQAGDHHHPEGEQPPVQAQHHGKGDQQKDYALRGRDALLGAQERLPEKQQRARPGIGDAAEHRDVQQQQHRHNDQPPIALAEAPGRVREAREHRLRKGRGLHGGCD